MISGDNRPSRVYFPGELSPDRSCVLPPRQAHHATRVLRLKSGDSVVLFNGDGAEYAAVIERVAKGGATVKVIERRLVERESRIEVVLGQALSSGERMEYTVQKAVELGVAAIHPLAASRSIVRLERERAARRVSHWQAVAIGACEQCGRNRVPPVAPVAPLEEFLERRGANHDAVLPVLLSPLAETRLRELPRPDGAVVLLAGPEGGFTPEEESLARRGGFVPVRLGPRVLRTETAAIAALAAMQALWGDF
ncbi:MAG: 16S rRNA (uracil(1498)-N(3))-methyltransferase [Betaproteobacteria bacterium]|nr:16S rRNA (uracil(1498)-N(3))-methyltransferase [Betaproteobacteria bacterium]